MPGGKTRYYLPMSGGCFLCIGNPKRECHYVGWRRRFVLNVDARELFDKDPRFNRLVHTMEDLLKEGELSIPELRAAVSLAANLYSHTNIPNGTKLSIPMSGLRIVAIKEGLAGYSGRVMMGYGEYWQTERCYPTEKEAKKAAGEFITGLMESGGGILSSVCYGTVEEDENGHKVVTELNIALPEISSLRIGKIVEMYTYKGFEVEIREKVCGKDKDYTEAFPYVGYAMNTEGVSVSALGGYGYLNLIRIAIGPIVDAVIAMSKEKAALKNRVKNLYPGKGRVVSDDFYNGYCIEVRTGVLGVSNFMAFAVNRDPGYIIGNIHSSIEDAIKDVKGQIDEYAKK